MDAIGPVLQSLLSGLPFLLLHIAVTLGILVVGVGLYTLVTPWKDIALIRQGNVAAGLAFLGAVLGLAIPLAFCLAISVSALDIVVWGAVTVVLQIAGFRFVDLLIRDVSARIENGEIAAALAVISGKLAVASVVAAAVGS